MTASLYSLVFVIDDTPANHNPTNPTLTRRDPQNQQHRLY